MADYQLSQPLFEKALDELRFKLRKKSPNVPDSLINHGRQHDLFQIVGICDQAQRWICPQPTKVLELAGFRSSDPERAARVNALLDEARTKAIDGQAKILDTRKANHRARSSTSLL